MNTIIVLAMFSQEKTVDDALKRIESALAGAKTVRVKFKSEGSGKRGDNETKIVFSGLLLLKEENRSRFETKSEVNSDEKATASIVSDGFKVRLESSGKSTDRKALKTQNLFYRNELLRLGMLGAAMLYPLAKPSKIGETYLLSNFGDGEEEKGIKTMTYDLMLAGNKGAGKVKLWYDPNGYKLLRRTLQFENAEDNVKVEVSETYEEYALDIEIPDDRFHIS